MTPKDQPHIASAEAERSPPSANREPIQLRRASQFSFDELVAAYNQARVDYIVPMPMNAERLREYVHTYDVDLDRSFVATVGDSIIGVAMLGVRPSHTWITRLGVLPVKRRRGSGQRLMEALIEESRTLDAETIILEVIKGNKPAHRLFNKLGFEDVRPLLVIRRPPGPPQVDVGPYTTRTVERQQITELLKQRRSNPSWLDEPPSLVNAGNLEAIRLQHTDGSRGWIVYQKTPFQLARLVLQAEAGEPERVGRALIHALHRRYPALDTKSENLPLQSPYWPALQEMGYIEAFQRIEMTLDLTGAG